MIVQFVLFHQQNVAKRLSLQENFKKFEQIVEAVGSPNNKTCSLKCFTVDVGADAVRYISQSLFQQYRLYQFLFTGEQQEEIIKMRVSALHRCCVATYIIAACR